MVKNTRKEINLDRELDNLVLRAGLINKENCMLIYNILLISGKLTPLELRKKTGLKKGSLFRSLKELLEAEVISREEDPSADDRRQSVFYRVTGHISVKIEQSLLDHAREKGEMNKIMAVMNSFQDFPVAASKFISRAIQNNQEYLRIKGGGPASLVQYVQLADIPEVKPLVEKIQVLINEMEVIAEKRTLDKELPMENPVMLTVSLTGLKNAFQEI